MRRSTRERLNDIIESAEKAVQIRPADRESFDTDWVVQLALTRLVEIIGEAANHVGRETQLRHPEVPWRAIVGMRNHITHGYFDVDVDGLWNVLVRDLPRLLPQIRVVLAELPAE